MRNLHILLVCCSVWWAGAARHRDCDSKLNLSSSSSSLSEGMGDIHSRSLSPWIWRMSIVPTRIPSTLWEAECSSSVCGFPQSRPVEGRMGTKRHTETDRHIETEGRTETGGHTATEAPTQTGGHTETGGEYLGLSAVPIYQQVLVLERRPGSHCFTTVLRPLSVGCTCIRVQTTTT